MLDNIQIEQQLTNYIRNNSLFDVSKLTPQTLLFKEGIFDSMTFVLLIDHIEENFSIKLGDEDLTEENFESILAITHYVLRKKGTSIT